ncbi:MAG: YHS domain-containing protein [Pseudomonadota bacterium]|nr:YHS domain-containing protein [Pseudomonadota bacterium]
MMRYGCGAHVMHGGPGHGGKADVEETDHVDPVCGMLVDPDTGYGKMHQGRLYRFCSRDCLDKFESEPARYAGAKQLEIKS